MRYAYLVAFCLFNSHLAYGANDYVLAVEVEDTALQSFELVEWNGVLYALERAPKVDPASDITFEVFDPRKLSRKFALEAVNDAHLLEINKRFLSYERARGVLHAVLTDSGIDAPLWFIDEVSDGAKDDREISTS